MASVGESLVSYRNAALSMLVALIAAALLLLPTQVVAFVLTWIAISVPVSVVVGHCVLSEEQ